MKLKMRTKKDKNVRIEKYYNLSKNKGFGEVLHVKNVYQKDELLLKIRLKMRPKTINSVALKDLTTSPKTRDLGRFCMLKSVAKKEEFGYFLEI